MSVTHSACGPKEKVPMAARSDDDRRMPGNRRFRRNTVQAAEGRRAACGRTRVFYVRGSSVREEEQFPVIFCFLIQIGAHIPWSLCAGRGERRTRLSYDFSGICDESRVSLSASVFCGALAEEPLTSGYDDCVLRFLLTEFWKFSRRTPYGLLFLMTAAGRTGRMSERNGLG